MFPWQQIIMVTLFFFFFSLIMQHKQKSYLQIFSLKHLFLAIDTENYNKISHYNHKLYCIHIKC